MIVAFVDLLELQLKLAKGDRFVTHVGTPGFGLLNGEIPDR